MMIQDCPACVMGQHSGHVANWNMRGFGIIDGEVCHCAGDCKERSDAAWKNLMSKISREVLSPDAQDLLNKLQSPDGATRDAAVRRVNALMEADPLPLSRTDKSDQP